MSPRSVVRLVAVGCGLWLACATSANAKPSEPAKDATYEAKLDARVNKIVSSLALPDSARQAQVHDQLIAQYHALNDWHTAHDAELKTLRKAASRHEAGAEEKLKAVDDSLLSLHATFLKQLGAILNAAQVEQVKDAMTYNKVKVTYDAYCQIVPNLSDADKAQILTLLKEAREQAMDAGSAEEKSAVFGRYKGKINNYLSSTGHNVKQAYKDWGARHAAKAPAEPAQK